MSTAAGSDALKEFAPDIRRVSSSALHGSPGKVVESVSAGAAVVVTRYSGTQAYVLSPELAETLAVKAAGLDALRRDLEAVRPFLDAAMRAGVSPLEVLDQVLHDSDEGTVAVDFAGLGRLMSRVPVALVAGEDGGPLARVELVGVSAVGTGADDDDYSAFDDE